MGYIRNMIGVVHDYIMIGSLGPRLKNNSGKIEARNNADDAYTQLVVADASANMEAMNLESVWQSWRYIPVAAGANCSSAIPNNTAARRILVVSVAGDSAVVGDLLFDNGLNDAAKMTIIPKRDGQMIVPLANVTALSLIARNGYLWDDTDAAWELAFDGGSNAVGGVNWMSLAVTTSTATHTANIPANSRIVLAIVDIGAAYNVETTYNVGIGSDTDLFFPNSLLTGKTTVNTFENPQYTTIGATATPLVATLANATSGASTVFIMYTNPITA